MKINKSFGQKIYIEWLDACECAGWKTCDSALKIPDDVFCKTNGFFLNKTKDFVTLAHTMGRGRNNDVTGIFHIPLGMIKKVR